MANIEVVVEATCPECGKVFTERTTVEVEPMRNEGRD